MQLDSVTTSALVKALLLLHTDCCRPSSLGNPLRIQICPMQGEMVQAKFGMPAVAGRQMEVFSTAVLLATHSPPRSPRKPEWRAHMERMSAISCEAYRDVRSCLCPCPC